MILLDHWEEVHIAYGDLTLVTLYGRDIDGHKVFNVEYEHKDSSRATNKAIELAKEHKIKIIKSWQIDEDEVNRVKKVMEEHKRKWKS